MSGEIPAGKSESRKICGEKTEVYSRVVGYFRPVQQWNKGKQEEFKDRVTFDAGSTFKVSGGEKFHGAKKVDNGASQISNEASEVPASASKGNDPKQVEAGQASDSGG